MPSGVKKQLKKKGDESDYPVVDERTSVPPGDKDTRGDTLIYNWEDSYVWWKEGEYGPNWPAGGEAGTGMCGSTFQTAFSNSTQGHYMTCVVLPKNKRTGHVRIYYSNPDSNGKPRGLHKRFYIVIQQTGSTRYKVDVGPYNDTHSPQLIHQGNAWEDYNVDEPAGNDWPGAPPNGGPG